MTIPTDRHRKSRRRPRRRRPTPRLSRGRAGDGGQADVGNAGFTLVELLVAATLALVAMAAVASLFGTFGRSVSQSQTLVDLTARLRSAASQLRQDLYGTTAPASPWLRPEANAGYLEIVEGTTGTDSLPAGTLGDVDDRITGTTMALGKPFTGSLQGPTAIEGFESPFAEIAWFCDASGQVFEGRPLFNLCRRQLLVSATPGAARFLTGVSATIDRNLSDISCRDAGTTRIANSLGDLTIAANRFWNVVGAVKTLQGARVGEDVILTNVIAFDVRTFSTGSSAYVDQSFNTNYVVNTPPPPGGQPLRGLQVRIRCLEPSTRQVRQVTVVHSFEGL
jgi:prepilin-type N-terminal cleavage/methylation domain-containing protein